MPRVHPKNTKTPGSFSALYFYCKTAEKLFSWFHHRTNLITGKKEDLESYIHIFHSSALLFFASCFSPFLCVNLTHDRLFLPNAIQIVLHSVLSGLTSVYSNIFFNSSIKKY